jgi:molybdopterin-containing oxidoreductase family membrane subunit
LLIPGSWRVYEATWVDKMTFLGTFGFFLMLFLLFLRFLPVIAIGEVKGVLPQSNPHHDDHGADGIQEEDLMDYADRHVPKALA